jgi:hypothetical protein
MRTNRFVMLVLVMVFAHPLANPGDLLKLDIEMAIVDGEAVFER